MKKVKTDYLDRYITKFCRKFGVYRAVSGNEFCFYDKVNVITYSMLHSQDELDHALYINKKYDCDIIPYYFIFSLLHEIGHCVTLPTIPKEELEAELIIRNTVLDTITDQDTMNEVYTNLASERLANEWAITYLEKHYIECWKFQKKIFARMKPYYKKMGVRISAV